MPYNRLPNGGSIQHVALHHTQIMVRCPKLCRVTHKDRDLVVLRQCLFGQLAPYGSGRSKDNQFHSSLQFT